MLGDVLTTIIGDDSNCFGSPSFPFNPEMAGLGREHLIIRLRWEIDTPETPDKIRRRLKRFLSEAERTDWQNESSFRDIRAGWVKKVKNFVKREIALNKPYKEAIGYELQAGAILSPEYQKFLHGS